MSIKSVAFTLSLVVIVLVLPSCDWFGKGSKRESIFDKVINIPKQLILDVPKLPPLCDELPDLKKGFAEVEDGKLYYEEEGKGIPLVLINGGPGGTHHGFHPHFSQIKDVAHIIYYDQRGTGKSSHDDTGKTYTIKHAVEDLDNLRKLLKLEKWAVLGWSYGGLLAQCYALKYPKHVMGLVLVASHSGLSEPEERRAQQFISPAEQKAIEDIQKKCNDGMLTTSAQVIYNKHLCGDWKNQSYYKPTTEEFIRKALYEWNPAPNFVELMRPESDKIKLKGKFDNFEIPTLVIEAKWDLLWRNPNRAELMRKNHPHAHVEIFEKAGHKIFADEPVKFFTRLKSFLEKRGR